jgi:SAM-dependent methyltransferase
MSKAEAIRRHYEAASETELLAEVERVIQALGTPLSAEALAGLDQFHLGGLAATGRLAELAGIAGPLEVLDAGSGLGGPSRVLAENLDCRVTGLDLSPAFVAIARLLADRTGLADRVRYEVGDLLALPFADAAFDLVWTQHVAMNIADRAALCAGFRRVLRAGGRLAFHDVLLPEAGEPPLYPTPWASMEADSHLLTEGATVTTLEAAGFRIAALHDVTSVSLAGLASAPPPAANGLARVMGPRFPAMAANFVRNLRDGRLRVMMGVAVAA